MKALRLPLSHVSKAFFISAALALAAVVAPDAQAQLESTSFFPGVQVQPALTTYEVVVGVKPIGGSYSTPVTFGSGDPAVAQVRGVPVFYGDGFFPIKYGGLEGYWGIWVATIEVLGQPGATTTITASQVNISVSQQLTVAGGANANVGYGPYSANSEGGMPRSDAYNVRVYRPDGTSGAETISFVVQPVQDPLNNPALTASFVYVTPSTVSFAAGELFKDVVVTCSIPTLNIPPGSTVKFVYKVLTSGWSVPVGDNGFALNATVTAPPPADSGPPVVVISQPSQLVYGPYTAGSVPATLPLSFQALTATPSTITSVDATITSTSFSSNQSREITLTAGTHIVGLGSQTATATTTQMPISGAGIYTVMAAGADSQGRRTQATTTFTVVVATPTPPTVVINSPTPGSVFVRTYGTNPWTIPFAFTANSPGGLIRTVSATLDNSSTPIVVTPVPFGLNVATVTASANLNLNTGGVHTLTVTVTDSLGGTATTTGTFTINLLQGSPIVSWNDPAPITYGTPLSGAQLNATVSGSVPGTFTYTPASGMVLPAGTHTLSVTFTPTDSVNYSSVTKTVQLTVNPAPLTIRANNKTKVEGDPLPTLTASYVGLVNNDVVVAALSTTATAASLAGDYPITVTVGPLANYSPVTLVKGTLTVTPRSNSQVAISGLVFLDVSPTNGTRQPDEPYLDGITVQLFQAGQPTRSVVTSDGGAYSFLVSPGTYEVDVLEPAGFMLTDSIQRTVGVTSTAVTVPDIGLVLNLNAIRGLRGDGLSHGYWKNNLDKAIAGKTSGTQESIANLQKYTTTIGSLYLSPFVGMTMPNAVKTMSGNDQLPLQLLASEYNYVSGRLINGSQPLTFAFIAWGEFVQKNSTEYSSSYRTYVKNWMDAFNNSHGGVVNGPALP